MAQVQRARQSVKYTRSFGPIPDCGQTNYSSLSSGYSNQEAALKLPSQQYSIFSNLSFKQTETLLNVYKELGKFKIIYQEEKTEKSNTLTYEEFEGLLGPALKPIFIIPLDQQPSNAQLPHWSSHLPVEVQGFSSTVIHGKGLAAKELGFPTANLACNEEASHALKDLPNGIYLVDCTIQGQPKRQGVFSVGFNPHYEDLKHSRALEVYVFHKYSQPFYGANVSVRVRLFMRTQGKFASFDAFLQAMHNDIFTGQRLAGQSGQSEP